MSSHAESAALFGVAQVELEIMIDAEPVRVWTALVQESSQWWNRDFYTNPAARGFIIEAKLGGRVYENWGDGSGQIWYTVIGLAPARLLMLQGILTPAFGGPAHSLLEIRMEPVGSGTIVQLSDTVFGKVGGGKLDQTREGWRILFEDGLKRFIEQT